ncbi:hypothetical protein Htur_5075 (plasmid) [Haloterrigena turkmenica DSM 5511]|uniref:Uncharacterized protein n=1 Tax=Haloterrigena turkmenica (strain ATCC 51198 / DSM 5511 / JCM 9101 / NCIMB 13204 / VKM B-1734 / 4k) TaxID=543526 RepID=D2S3L5_HALTV|nr:hypothetical protein Htur_5075 [Haloterrigena turkmenica DSM 5511]
MQVETKTTTCPHCGAAVSLTLAGFQGNRCPYCEVAL